MEILKEAQRTEKEKKPERSTITGSLCISYSINTKTGKYTFIYSFNDETEAFSTESLEEALDHITQVIKANAINKRAKNPEKPKKQEEQEENKIMGLFDI